MGLLYWEALGWRWDGVGMALGGRWEGVGRALGGRWRVVRVGSGSLIYRQIKSLHVQCSGYLLVDRYVDEIRIRSSFFTSVLDCFRNSLKSTPSRVLLYDKLLLKTLDHQN